MKKFKFPSYWKYQKFIEGFIGAAFFLVVYTSTIYFIDQYKHRVVFSGKVGDIIRDGYGQLLVLRDPITIRVNELNEVEADSQDLILTNNSFRFFYLDGKYDADNRRVYIDNFVAVDFDAPIRLPISKIGNVFRGD